MHYSPPAEDWTEKQLQDKQFAKSKMHVSGSPCRCNTAYLADAPCFIDAESPGFTRLRSHQPDEISAMLHFTTTRQAVTLACNKLRALLSFLFSLPLVVCHQTDRVPFGRILFKAGKHKWKDEDKPRASAAPSSSQAQPLDVDTFCSLRSFLPTGGRTSDWPNKHISNSVELLFDSCLLKDIICTAQTRVGPS